MGISNLAVCLCYDPQTGSWSEIQAPKHGRTPVTLSDVKAKQRARRNPVGIAAAHVDGIAYGACICVVQRKRQFRQIGQHGNAVSIECHSDSLPASTFSIEAVETEPGLERGVSIGQHGNAVSIECQEPRVAQAFSAGHHQTGRSGGGSAVGRSHGQYRPRNMAGLQLL